MSSRATIKISVTTAMKLRWGLDSYNALRHLEIPLTSATPLRPWSKRRPPIVSLWAKKQTSVQPQPIKYLALCWGYLRVWIPTHRRANKEDNKVVNRDWGNHQACSLSHHIYIIAYAFVSHANFLKLFRKFCFFSCNFSKFVYEVTIKFRFRQALLQKLS